MTRRSARSRCARVPFQREHPRDERVGAFAVPDQPVVRSADERVRGSVRTVRTMRVDATLQARAVWMRRHVSDDYAARSPGPRERPREQRRGGGVRVVLVRWRRGGRRRRRVDPVGVVVPVVVVVIAIIVIPIAILLLCLAGSLLRRGIPIVIIIVIVSIVISSVVLLCLALSLSCPSSRLFLPSCCF